MPRTRFASKKDNASEAEVASEISSELSSDERGDAEVVDMEEVEFIYDYANDEYEGKFEIPPSKKRRGGIGRQIRGAILMRHWINFEIHQLKVSEKKEEFGVRF